MTARVKKGTRKPLSKKPTASHLDFGTVLSSPLPRAEPRPWCPAVTAGICVSIATRLQNSRSCRLSLLSIRISRPLPWFHRGARGVRKNIEIGFALRGKALGEHRWKVHLQASWLLRTPKEPC